MAHKTQVLLTCDLHGDDTPAVETVTFGYESRTYAFELCQQHLSEFRQSMDSWIKTARPEGRAPGRARRRSATAAPRRKAAGAGPASGALADVRSWARSQGYQVSDRGRLSGEVLSAYASARRAARSRKRA